MENYVGLGRRPNAIAQLTDDFLYYIGDTLSWIPTYNPARNEDYAGLCWYGPTIIDSRGIEKTTTIFRCWMEILKEGPDPIILTGEFSWVGSEPVESGKYEKLGFDKATLLENTRKLVMFCEEVNQSNGLKQLLHLGI